MRATPRWTEFLKYPIVSGTVVLAIAVTIAWSAKVNISPLFETAMIRRGELWRLLTSILPHAGFLHLAFNVYWLWVFGTLVEQQFGHLRTAALIALLAIVSGSFEFALALGGVGLSGVGYGLFGMLWVLSKRDDRFREAVDERTVLLFVLWFFLCIVMTLTHVFAVGNIAHGVGAIVGALVGATISTPRYRARIAACIGAIIVVGLWGSTLGRPRVNLSRQAGYEEGKWGYDALAAGQNAQAVRWLVDATIYQPKLAVYWYDLGIAYQRLNNPAAAKVAYEKAHQLEPNDAGYSQALKNLD
jgi:membrane associated rhomboid family serine protease